MPLLKNMMDKQQLQVKDVDLLACSEGPGSFTGIRIGMATIKAFSDACNKPVTGISSLEALAYEVIEQKGRKDCKILSMIDARNDNVYFSVYRIKNGNLSVYKNPDVMSMSDVVEYVNFVEPLYIIGDVFKEKLEPLLRAKISKEQAQARDVVQHEYINSTGIMAGAIGLAAFDKYDIGDYGDSDEIMPMYLRRPQAERQRDGGDDKIDIVEMTFSDIEEIKMNYEKFPNIWDFNTFEDDSKTSKYMVAKQNYQIVGFISTQTVLDELEIMNIVTRQDKRNRGIASNLISYVIRKNNVNKINLEVNENNKVAISIYKEIWI